MVKELYSKGFLSAFNFCGENRRTLYDEGGARERGIDFSKYP
jgi:hypothetical protein